MTEKENIDLAFSEAFAAAQQELGLNHYHVTIRRDDSTENYAECDAEAEDCIAVIRYNPDRCRNDRVIASTAVHEALHLLLRDLVHALECNPKAARIEEERAVRRLEAVVARGIFGTHET